MFSQIGNFNPRSLVGNDKLYEQYNSKNDNFNPRSLVGNDCKYTILYTLSNISIHVPSWGTTSITHITATNCPISIHVPSWGTTKNQ